MIVKQKEKQHMKQDTISKTEIEFDKFIEKAHHIAMAKMLLREGSIDTTKYNAMIRRIQKGN